MKRHRRRLYSERPYTQNSHVTEARWVPEDPSGILYGRRSNDKPGLRKSQFFVTFCHWCMVLLLVVETLTGMRMGWGYAESPFGGPQGHWSSLLDLIAPRATLFGVNIVTLHNVGAWLLLLIVIIYVGYLYGSGAFKRMKLSLKDLKTIRRAIGSGATGQSKRGLWAANVAVYWFGFLSILVLLITGIALYRVDLGLYHYMGGYRMTHGLHAWFTYSIVPFTLIHVCLQRSFGTFWSIFKASFHPLHLTAGCMALAVALMLVGALYARNQQPLTLTVKRITDGQIAPKIDGNPDDVVWENANKVVIKTVKGINNHIDDVDVSVAGYHDGVNLYLQFQWNDPDRSEKQLSDLPTQERMVELTALARNRKDVYAEDKLAVYITQLRNNPGCASSP